ncbi:hypothetical protein ACFQ2B_22030 [Streptomyces stramineus]
MRFSRWHRAPWARAALAGLYVVALAAAVPQGAGGHGRDGSWTGAEARRFWGPTPMSASASAAGDGARHGTPPPPSGSPAAHSTSTGCRRSACCSPPTRT